MFQRRWYLCQGERYEVNVDNHRISLPTHSSQLFGTQMTKAISERSVRVSEPLQCDIWRRTVGYYVEQNIVSNRTKFPFFFWPKIFITPRLGYIRGMAIFCLALSPLYGHVAQSIRRRQSMEISTGPYMPL